MYCPSCKNHETKVINSRHLKEGLSVRRRRECSGCGHRYTTYERVETRMPDVVKRDGRREAWDSNKIYKGLKIASQKRPIPVYKLEEIIANLELNFSRPNLKEVTAQEIGTFLTKELRDVDHVAFIRFASIYWNYDNLSSFVEGLKKYQIEDTTHEQTTH